jgi:glucose-1-phosphate adenylyltransferase
MGIYLFRTEVLLEMLRSSQENDFGRDIIPGMLDTHRVYAYPTAGTIALRITFM